MDRKYIEVAELSEDVIVFISKEPHINPTYHGVVMQIETGGIDVEISTTKGLLEHFHSQLGEAIKKLDD